MNLLTRYMGREIYASVALVGAALLMLFAFLDLIHELNSMGQGQYNLGYVLLFVLLTLPGHVYELFPVVVLIGTIFALVQMAANSEMTVFRASGASQWQMLAALCKIAVPLVVLGFVCGELLAPPSERMAQKLRLMAQNSQVTLKEFRSGVWAKDDLSFVNVKGVMPDGSLSGVDIYRFDTDYRLQDITHAAQADFAGQGVWKLQQVTETHFNTQGVVTQGVTQREWRSAMNPDIFNVLLVVPEQMSALDLYRYAAHLRENHQKSARYEIVMWGKLTYPITLMVMMLLALPFAAYRRRSGGVSAMVLLGIVIGLSFHFFGRLVASLGSLNEWQPFMSATVVSWVFLAGGVGMLWWIEQR
jgi:lipopolysaccharide export system permease protein